MTSRLENSGMERRRARSNQIRFIHHVKKQDEAPVSILVGWNSKSGKVGVMQDVNQNV